MAKQAQILNLDDILAEEVRRTVVYKGKEYGIAGVTGEAYLRFLSKQAQINKAIESGDLEAQWKSSLELLKFVAPDLPLDELQKLPWKAFQQVVTFVMAVFQEEAEATTDGEGPDSSRGQTADGEEDASLGESTSP